MRLAADVPGQTPNSNHRRRFPMEDFKGLKSKSPPQDFHIGPSACWRIPHWNGGWSRIFSVLFAFEVGNLGFHSRLKFGVIGSLLRSLRRGKGRGGDGCDVMVRGAQNMVVMH